MQGFVVLGVRPGRIEQLAQTKVRAQERRLKNCPTPESHERRMVKAIERAEQRPPRIELSPEYSAPQFAVDWARLAQRQGFSHLVVAFKHWDSSTGRYEYDPTPQQP